MAAGIVKRHSKGCRARTGRSCDCEAGYEAWVYSPRDGRKVRRTFASYAEARSWRADAKRQIDQGTLRAPAQQMLREAAEAWLAGAERGEVRNRSGDPYKPSTLRGYRQALEERVLPLIGGEKLSAITTSDLQLLVDRWQAEGLPPSTLRNILKPLQAIYRRAKSRGGLLVNPTQDLELPAPRPREVEIVSPEVAEQLLAAAPKQDRPIWATALYAGLRYGELRALRWGAVDVAGGTIEVRDSWDAKAGRIDPKTRTSRRRVPMPATLRELILDRRL
jgi:integrase